MSIVTMILGESGTGKSTSLRNLDPANTLLIQAVKKPLPFRSQPWTVVTKDNKSGSIWYNDNSDHIVTAITKTDKEIIIIDDFQYILSNEFMRRSDEKGFAKFLDIGRHGWDILMAAGELPDNKRVYILSHTYHDDHGRVRAKTIGKLLDEKITIEGLVTIVLRTQVVNGQYIFSTKNNGVDTVKSPIGLFETEHIDNDLSLVDKAIQDYYTLSTH